MVDGQVKQALIPHEGGRLYELIKFKTLSDMWAHSDVPVAPFDQEVSTKITVVQSHEAQASHLISLCQIFR